MNPNQLLQSSEIKSSEEKLVKNALVAPFENNKKKIYENVENSDVSGALSKIDFDISSSAQIMTHYNANSLVLKNKTNLVKPDH